MSQSDDCYQTLVRYCMPAGLGVKSRSVGATALQNVQRKIYGSTEPEAVQQRWLSHLEDVASANQPLVLGVCSDTGASVERGANWGPLYLRNQWYQVATDHLTDLGDLRIVPQLLMDEYHSDALLKQCRQSLYGDANVTFPVSPLSVLEEVAGSLWRRDPHCRLLTLGGDQSISYALIRQYIQTRCDDHYAIIHFDAHPDLHVDNLGVGVTYDTWSSHILPMMADPSHFIQLGLRASDRGKDEWQAQYGVTQYWADEILSQSPKIIANKIIEHCQAHDIKECYLTFDIDVLDITQASATGTPENNGLTVPQILTIIDTLSRQLSVASADIVEVAPFVCMSSNKNQEPHRTLTSARHVMASLVHAMRVEK